MLFLFKKIKRTYHKMTSNDSMQKKERKIDIQIKEK